jgi:hypothetical protein
MNQKFSLASGIDRGRAYLYCRQVKSSFYVVKRRPFQGCRFCFSELRGLLYLTELQCSPDILFGDGLADDLIRLSHLADDRAQTLNCRDFASSRLKLIAAALAFTGPKHCHAYRYARSRDRM